MAEGRRWSVRPWVRALHRDLGYLAVGLTVVYALSGLAVNHIADWDPNFRNHEATHRLGPLTGEDDEAIAREVLRRLSIREPPSEVYRASPEQLDVVFPRKTLHIYPTSGEVTEEGQQPRFLLRTANWLHLNRGKKAWTYIADAYAVGLLLLALSGLFMIPGRKGLLGRGAVLVAVGAAIPVIYVELSGGPEATSGKPAMRSNR
ncbi:MAG: PepSY-associated TM helix domain-containing protein [Myxococcales bacterium]|nr:PepSY-associated TM helix domain-containing protein [Polyangiaceae bacterium]MDW8247882.1 PepSY-associated TM helix domain-containing protein [Myxococcales bacterium]